MTLETFREHCLALPDAEETLPFGPDILVYKVGGKMFATASQLGAPDRPATAAVNLKCDPDRALDLRADHEEITPGYHMNKRHWNTLDLHGHLPGALIQELIAHSYTLVLASLPKSTRAALLPPLSSKKCRER